MKSFTENCFLISVLVFIYLIFSSRYPVGALVLLCMFCRWRTHDRIWAAACLCMLACLIPHSRTDMPQIQEGRVIEVKESYAVIRNGGYKLLVYTDEPLPFDARISFSGFPEPIVSSSGFYSGSFSSYCSRKGIYYSVDPDHLEVMEQKKSFRAWLQKKCGMISDQSSSKLAGRMLLGISSSTLEESFLVAHGFSLSAVLAVLEGCLKYIIDRRRRTMVMLPVYALAAYLYGFPLILVQTFLFRFLSLMHLPSDQRMGTAFLIIMFLYPEAPYSAGFLLPAVFRIAGRFFHGRKSTAWLVSMLVQNLLFQTLNPLMTFGYMFLRRLIGAVWLITFAAVIFSIPSFLSVTLLADRILSSIGMMELPGSILGAGLPFFLLLLFSVRRSKRASQLAVCFLVFFQYTGLFHPFAEITFINVGQGDSILIRAPLNSGNVLIDTGKPSALSRVTAMLDAKGIRHLDALILTHADDDHSGSRSEIEAMYHPAIVLDDHHAPGEIAGYMFYDLNPISSGDENSSSLTEYVRINGMDVLLTGDIDAAAEEAIISRYGNLHADLLKLAHHGSSTSSSARFLDTVRPSLAVISAGAYEMYHHPSDEVIQRLLKRHIPYLNTRQEGDVTVLCIGRWNLLVTSSGKFSLIPL